MESVHSFGEEGVLDIKTSESPRASTCADICLNVSLLSSPAVPHFICLSALGFHTNDEGSRCSTMRCGSNPPFFFFLSFFLFFFFDTWQINNGVLAALRWSGELTPQLRCFNKFTWMKMFVTGSEHAVGSEFLQVLVAAVQ